jgi:histidyl-tRNA synthetase
VPEFRAPVGTRDVLPPESARWVALVARFAERARTAGYGLVLSPMFEDVGVFERVGEATDVVRKEMYDFTDKGDRHLALRPEGTASIVRAYIQHRPTPPWKVWYAAPNFRYERPQAGRFRQHHQLGVEVLGSDDPDVDVEVIAFLAHLFTDLGLRRTRLRLNSLGDDVCRPGYRELLLAFLEEHRSELCDEHRDRIAENPLRVLDCKRPSCIAATSDAPRMLDNLCEPCAAHFDRVKTGLSALGIAFHLDTALVRGLDYYTRTTFEFAADALESTQNAIGGGGRYDGLAEALGGPRTPGIGFGAGVERVLLACDAEGVFDVDRADVAHHAHVDVFVVDTAGGDDARDVTDELRAAGVSTDRSFDNRSMKAQFKAADRSGARVAVVIGPDESAARTATVRPLRDGGEQETIGRADLVDHLRKRLSQP